MNHPESGQSGSPLLSLADILSGLLCLIGILPGLVCYNRLPARIPIHWNIQGHPDDWAPKPFVVFVLPCLMLVMHLLFCVADSRLARSQSRPVRRLTRLIVPLIALTCECLAVLYACRLLTDMARTALCLTAALLIVTGNYLPKTRPNHFFGIRLPWTLADEEVWRRTHHLGGWLFLVGGVVILILGLTGYTAAAFAVLAVVAAAPILYSGLLCFRLKKQRDASPHPQNPDGQNG